MPPPMVFDTPEHPYDPQDDDVFMEDVTMELPEMHSPAVKSKKKLSLKTRPDGAPLMVKPEHFNLRPRDRPIDIDEPPKEKKPLPKTVQKQQSKLQQQLNMDKLVAKVLATPMTITIQELLGASPPTSKKIQEYL